MQDSLEDYIRLAKNTTNCYPTQIKSEVSVRIQRKKECDNKAKQIVEFSIEGKLRPEVFLKCLDFINQDYYQDVVEERSVSKLCGYPICGNRIPTMPKKQYHISTKNNVIYDITERKNFCSNFCYKASVHIKNQINTSPLWLRRVDELTQFNLLPTSERGSPGVAIDQGIAKPVKDDVGFTSISTFAHLSLDEIEKTEIQPKKGNISKFTTKAPMETISEDTRVLEADDKNTIIKKTTIKEPGNENNEIKNESKSQVTINDADISVVDAKKQSSSRRKQSINNKTEKAKRQIDIENQIKKALKEWLSVETYIFIYGENKIKSPPSANNDDDNNNLIEQQKLNEIDRKLNLVESFYGGDLYAARKINKDDNNKTTDESEPVLPLMDGRSQNAMRQKIFFNSLNKAMQNLLQALNISRSQVLSDVQALVKTFKLNATNVVFRPVVWNYIAIVLLQILALRNRDLVDLLKEHRSQEYINLYLESLSSKRAFLTNVLTEFEHNIDLFIKKNNNY